MGFLVFVCGCVIVGSCLDHMRLWAIDGIEGIPLRRDVGLALALDIHMQARAAVGVRFLGMKCN